MASTLASLGLLNPLPGAYVKPPAQKGLIGSTGLLNPLPAAKKTVASAPRPAATPARPAQVAAPAPMAFQPEQYAMPELPPAPNFEEILKRTMELQRQSAEPYLRSLEGGIGETQSAFAAERARLANERTPLQQRYQKLISDVTTRGQNTKNEQIKITNRELGRRGLSADSNLAEQEIQNVVKPIDENVSSLVKDLGMDQEAGLRDLDAKSGALTTQETGLLRDIRNTIAQLQAGGSQNAVQNALNQLNSMESARQFAISRTPTPQQLSEMNLARRMFELISLPNAQAYRDNLASGGGAGGSTGAIDFEELWNSA